MSNWNGLDFFIFLIFFLNTILGMSRGASREIISMMCLSVGLIFMIKFTVPLANLMNSSPIVSDFLSSPFFQRMAVALGVKPFTINMTREMAYCTSLLITFSGAFCVCEGMLSVTGFKEVFSFPYATLNRKVGGALGCTRGYILALLLIVILSQHLFRNQHDRDSVTNLVQRSLFARLFENTARHLDKLVAGEKVDRYQELYRDKSLYDEKEIMKVFQ